MIKIRNILLAVGVVSQFWAPLACAEDGTVDHANMDHSAHLQSMDTPVLTVYPQPTQPGQGAFAAIGEIVEILQNDPNTDWSMVNIDALREHLVDMTRLTLGAKVEQVSVPNGVKFIVTGEADVLRAVQSMIPAHTVELDKIASWTASAELIDGGAVLMVLTGDANELVKLKALGFFGLMATGAHHQEHHLGMATGLMNHH